MVTKEVVINNLDYSILTPTTELVKLVPLNPNHHDSFLLKRGSKIMLPKTENWGDRGLIIFPEQNPEVTVLRPEHLSDEDRQLTTQDFLGCHGKIILINGQVEFDPENLPMLIFLAINEFGFVRDKSFKKKLWNAVIQASLGSKK